MSSLIGSVLVSLRGITVLQVEVILKRLSEIVRVSGSPDLSLGERAGLFAGVCEVERLVSEFIDEHAGGDGYAHEKITQVRWHVGAALGFDITNGHDESQHRVWAMGSLSSLEDVLAPVIAR